MTAIVKESGTFIVGARFASAVTGAAIVKESGTLKERWGR
jgi:hypothetical protein